MAFWIGRGAVPDPTLDDAWIYLSAARTLRDTGRLAASPHHELLVGITCPIYPTLLAGLGSAIDLPRAAAAIGLLAAMLVPWFAFSFLLQAQPEPRSAWLAMAATLPVGLSGVLAANAITGMESILYALGVAVVASVHARRGLGWRSGLAAAALAALRTDGAMVAAAISGEALFSLLGSDRKERPHQLRRLGEFLVPVSIAAAGLAGGFLLVTGRPVANTPAARIALYGWGEGSPLARLRTGAAAATDFALANPWWAALWILGAAACWGGSRRVAPAAATGRWLTLLSLAYAVVLGLAGVPLAYHFSRYFLPAITAGSIVAGLGFTWGWLGEHGAWQRRAVVGIPALVALVLGAVADARQTREHRLATDLLEESRSFYDVALREVADLSGGDDRIAVIDVGWPLWILRRPVLDLGGLVDARATEISMRPDGRWVPFENRDVAGLLARNHVRWLVILEPLWNRYLPLHGGSRLRLLPFGNPYSAYEVVSAEPASKAASSPAIPELRE